MSFTIHRADGTDELLSSELGTAGASAATNIFSEDGIEVLSTHSLAGYQYFVQSGNSWQDKIRSAGDTLVTSSGNDFLVWDSATTSNMTFGGVSRARLQTSNTTRLLRLVELGDGNDIANLSHSVAGTLPPGAYAAAATIYGGAGNDRIAFGGGADAGYGGADGDTIWGNGGNDLLVGGGSLDSLFGGGGSDEIVGEVDALANDGDFIVGWEGGDYAQPVTIFLSAGDQIMSDYVDGGWTFDPDDIRPDLDTDTLYLQMPAASPGTRNVLNLSGPGSFQPHIFGIEVIAASAAADVINLSWSDGSGSGFFYDQDVTILAGDGNDVVFAGDGADLIVGDALGNVSGFSDTLFGGWGSDTIYGDTDNGGPGAADTIFGGLGHDTGFGGAGDDVLVDYFDANYFGGMGNDLIFVHFYGGDFARLDGGAEDTSEGIDGDDRVFVTGVYNVVESELGQGSDIFISLADESSEIGSGQRIDSVYGGSGNDAISSWFGDDTIFGGPGDDVIWGGPDNDYVSAGEGSDLIYMEGGADVAYGGAGHDYYYVMMAGGNYADIYDEARDGEGDATPTSNKLILAGGFASQNEAGEVDVDGWLDGYGIYDLNHDLEDVVYAEVNGELVPIDVVELYRVDGEEFVWEIYNHQTGYFVQFDQRDIDGIALINNDAAPGATTVEYYLWSDADQTYVYRP